MAISSPKRYLHRFILQKSLLCWSPSAKPFSSTNPPTSRSGFGKGGRLLRCCRRLRSRDVLQKNMGSSKQPGLLKSLEISCVQKVGNLSWEGSPKWIASSVTLGLHPLGWSFWKLKLEGFYCIGLAFFSGPVKLFLTLGLNDKTRFLAICHYLNLNLALGLSSATCFLAVVCLAYHAGSLSSIAKVGQGCLNAALIYLPMGVFLTSYFLGHFLCKKSFWFDRVCINQDNMIEKTATLQAVPSFVARSDRMLASSRDVVFATYLSPQNNITQLTGGQVCPIRPWGPPCFKRELPFKPLGWWNP